jgi:Protein of unknown function (DUF3551)
VVLFMMRPNPLFRMSGRAARVSITGARTKIEKKRSQSPVLLLDSAMARPGIRSDRVHANAGVVEKYLDRAKALKRDLVDLFAARADGSWCAYYGSGSGGTNCGFYSWEQCQAAISGNGGYCARNQWYSGARD